jgi:hypothetical protein
MSPLFDGRDRLPVATRRCFLPSRFELANLLQEWERLRRTYPEDGDLAEACHHLQVTVDALTSLLAED